MSSIANDLPNDILLLIFGTLQDDYNTLFRSALVNRAFNRASSKYLYRRVVLAPTYRLVLSFGEVDSIPANSNLISATLSQYAEYVETFEVTGFLPSPKSRSSEKLSAIILNAIFAFTNLHTLILTPATFEDIFTGILKHFVERSDKQTNDDAHSQNTHPVLRALVVNTSCTNEERAPVLSEITGLSRLSIISPTRAILDLLPDWLLRLSDSLTELHLRENCGSITPGVLKFILPSLKRELRKISLGLSYSLTDEDVFTFLHQLQNLNAVELTYYWQFKPPISRPNLAQLHSFTANHTNFQTRREATALCKWIRRAIAPSPIQRLRIVQTETNDDEDDDDVPSNTGANVCYRSIVDHLCSRHSHTLCILDMKSAYIDVKSLKKLFTSCKQLEEVSLCAGSQALTIFKKHGSSLIKLRTAAFEIRNIRLSRRRVVDMELVTAIMKHGPPLLRRLSVNGQTWESAWKKTKEGTFSLAIHKQPKLIYPWDRKLKPGLRHPPEDRRSTDSPVGNTAAATTAFVPSMSATAAGKKPANQLRVRFS